MILNKKKHAVHAAAQTAKRKPQNRAQTHAEITASPGLAATARGRCKNRQQKKRGQSRAKGKTEFDHFAFLARVRA